MGIDKLKDKLKECGITFVWKGEVGYDDSREICNSRFDYKPTVVAFCKNEKNISDCIKLSKEFKIGFRVRSGGHQHEGMCSANDVMMINLSEMNHWEYVSGTNNMKAWIQPGKPLGELYKELEADQRIIPGGGCSSVCVGGLTQGGGWGPSLRKLGLTCDNIEEARLIDANGETKILNKDSCPDLFWAIRGGGGGNFGIITNFLFKLTKIEEKLNLISCNFTKIEMPEAVRAYIKMLPGLSDDITSFGRLRVVNTDEDKNAFFVWAQSYGTMEALRDAFRPLCDLSSSGCEENMLTVTHHEAHQLFNGVIPDSLKKNPNIKAEQFLYQPATNESNDDINTCGSEPHPHKVTSGFPKSTTDYAALFKIIVDRFQKETEISDQAMTYLSIHSMGGVLKEKLVDTAFPFRSKEFMFQFQAWWHNPKDIKQDEYIEWIESFRDDISDYIEGAFINFPDKLLVKDPDEQRVELLQYYYMHNLDRLREVKSKYDPDNVFSFGMSIPPE